MSTIRYITLVRHAQSVSAGVFRRQSFDEPLSILGKEQAKRLAKRYATKEIPIDTLCSSPMKRALETAEIIAADVGVQHVCTLNDAQERKVPSQVMDLITHSDESRAIIDEVFSAWLNDPNKQVYDEETYASLMTRVKNIQHELITMPAEHITLVTHATFMKAFLNDVFHIDRSTPQTFLAIYHSHEVTNTGIVQFSYSENNGWRLITWNDKSHLAQLDAKSEQE